jgi:hypothetical protein
MGLSGRPTVPVRDPCMAIPIDHWGKSLADDTREAVLEHVNPTLVPRGVTRRTPREKSA